MKILTIAAVAALLASPAFAETAAPGTARTMDSTSPAKTDTVPDASTHRSTTEPSATKTDNKQTPTGGQPGGSSLTGR